MYHFGFNSYAGDAENLKNADIRSTSLVRKISAFESGFSGGV